MTNIQKNTCEKQKDLEVCKNIIYQTYKKYKNENGKQASYIDAEFYEVLEKDHRIISLYKDVFIEAYKIFLHDQSKLAFNNKIERIKMFLFSISNTLRKII